MSAVDKHLHQKTIKLTDAELEYANQRALADDISFSEVMRMGLHCLISRDRKTYNKLKPIFESMPELQGHSVNDQERKETK